MLPFLLPLLLAASAPLEVVTTLSGPQLYEQGIPIGLMRSGDTIILNDLELLEDDAPGAGLSEKGEHTLPLHAGMRLRKRIALPDPRTLAAHAVIYMTPQDPLDPRLYSLTVNGTKVPGLPVPWQEPVWHWVPLQPSLLVSGDNELILECEAPPGKGYEVLVAREDEYDRGGGKWTYRGNTAAVAAGLINPTADPPLEGLEAIEVGNSSSIQSGGVAWAPLRVGVENPVAGELSIRLSLQRYVSGGEVLSPVIDLWADRAGQITQKAELASLVVTSEAETPEGTGLGIAIRFSDAGDPEGPGWGAFQPIDSSEPGNPLPLESPCPRFAQLRVQFYTNDPLATPLLRSVQLRRTLRQELPPATLIVSRMENPQLQSSAYFRRLAGYDHPQLNVLRERLKLDALLEGSTSDFERINRVRHQVSQLWYHKLPYPEYPEWSALAVLDRNDKYGWGGMCMQFVTVFTQALQSLGYQARHVNLFNHESAEVWVDELGKWVLVDPESVFDSYEFDVRSGMPLNALDQHNFFLKRYGFSGDNPISWMSPQPWCNWPVPAVPETPQPLDISTFTPELNHPDPLKRPPQHNLAGFFRIIPRNDFVEAPTPRPLNNGSTYWPWNGFLCWYDEATPRKLQYALHSDREADFYPSLNQVHFAATYTERPGEVHLEFSALPHSGNHFEVKVGEGDWQALEGGTLDWQLRRSALNRLQVRTRNALGVSGRPSALEVFWHYQAPFEQHVPQH